MIFNKTATVILFCMYLFIVVGCSKDAALEFALHKASLHNADPEQAEGILEEKLPFLTSDDTDSYSWDGKKLTVNVGKLQEKLGKKSLRQGFVLKIDNKTVYYGEFWSVLSSALPDKRIRSIFLVQPGLPENIELFNMEDLDD